MKANRTTNSINKASATVVDGNFSLPEARYPRIMAAGADYNDLQQVIQRCSGGRESWPAVWEELASKHEALGDAALRDGLTITAGEAFVRAALYYHTAQVIVADDVNLKVRMQHLQQAAYLKGAPYLSPPTQVVHIPYKGQTFPGYLRLPLLEERPAACVILLAGLDSTKEEFHTLENEFLKRGMATFSFDGPGQSLTRERLPLEPTIEGSVGAILDVLTRRVDLDSERFGVWGRSFGGHMAPRAAAYDKRLKACVSVGGFYTLPVDQFPEPVLHELTLVTASKNTEETRKKAAKFTLAGLMPKISCPMLVVHSQPDSVCSYKEAERMVAEAGDNAELVLYPDGNHVCDNIAYKSRPLMADWLARKLGLSSSYLV